MSVFLSTLSLRRATPWHGVVITSLHHFYPRSPCGERRFGPGVGGAQQRISIHALLAESDPIQAPPYKYNDISIHALLAESDESKQGRHYIGCNFYPRSPCGERRECQQERRRMCQFLSTLSLRRATLTSFKGTYSSFHQFLSTLSLRRATLGARHRHAHNLAFLSTLSLRRATLRARAPE